MLSFVFSLRSTHARTARAHGSRRWCRARPRGVWLSLFLVVPACAPYCPKANARQPLAQPASQARPIAQGPPLAPAGSGRGSEARRLRPCAKDAVAACHGDRVSASPSDVRPEAVPIGADDPVRGRAEAPIAIVVYSDFQCPFCAKLLPVLEQLLERHPRLVRLVWKDLPSPGHPQAAPAALLARQIFTERGPDAFWTTHDQLFTHQEELSDDFLRALAHEQKLDWPPPPHYESKLSRSQSEADALGVAATPTIFIGERVIVGARSSSVYESAIDAAAARLAAAPSAR